MSDTTLVLITSGQYSDYQVGALYRVPVALRDEMNEAIECLEDQADAIRKTQGYKDAWRAANARAEAARSRWAERIRKECARVRFVELWDGSH